MNQNINKVEIPRNAKYEGKRILSVLSAVVSDNPEESGYLVLLEDGNKVHVPASVLEAK